MRTKIENKKYEEENQIILLKKYMQVEIPFSPYPYFLVYSTENLIESLGFY